MKKQRPKERQETYQRKKDEMFCIKSIDVINELLNDERTLTKSRTDCSMEEDSSNEKFASDQVEVKCNKFFSKKRKLFASN